jgi:AcrR family transcriptional regulator
VWTSVRFAVKEVVVVLTGSRQEKAAGTEAALKQAAREVFAERGYLNTKITDITAAAGRATGSFYNHFAGKEELLEALLTDMLAEADDVVLEDADHTADYSDRAAIRWHVAMFWRFYRAHLPEMIAVKQASMVDPVLGRRLQQIMADDDAHMVEHFAHLPTPPTDPTLHISAMNALMEGFAYQWLVVNAADGRTIEDEVAIELLTDLLHHGLTG